MNKKPSNSKTIHDLVYSGDTKKLYNYLHYKKKNYNILNIINEYNNKGKTPLHIAVKNNFQDIAMLLINFGADKEMVNNKGQKVVWTFDQKGGTYNKKLYGKRYI